MSGVAGWLAAASAIPAAWLLHWGGGFPLVVAATAATFAAAWLRSGERALIARFGGQMLTLWALSGGLWFAGVAPHIFPWPGWVGAFVLCQAIGWGLRRRLPAVWGDVAAGAIAACVILVSAAISHGWLN